MARRQLAAARALEVPVLPDEDIPPPDKLTFAQACGVEPDPWQAKVLASTSRKIILCCSRQSGKSTVTGIDALHTACFQAGALCLLLSPSQRQSGELHRTVKHLHNACTLPIPEIVSESALRLELANGARIIALPGEEANIRGYSGVTLAAVDEAARVPDSMIAAIRPMLAVSNGRLTALSTPFGKRGWFWEQWAKGEGWERTMVKAADCPRISPEFLEDERRELGEFVFANEYLCEFQDAETSVFATDLILAALAGGDDPLWPEGSPAWML
jgi:hypothetical protein